jgi:hypothetical protein
MASLRAQYLASQRNLRFEEINRDPTLRINQAAIDLLVNRVDAQGLPAPSAAPSSSEAPSPSDKPSIPPGK